MGVVITNFKMPRSCHDCNIGRDVETWHGGATYCPLANGYVDVNKFDYKRSCSARDDKCPLVEG